MGLFKKIANFISGAKEVSHKDSKTRGQFEQMEPRRMLDADPIHVGAVYIESDAGNDNTPDTFEITFQGGAAGTQLKQVVINGDKSAGSANAAADVLAVSDIFFDSIQGGFGHDGAHGFNIISNSGIQSIQAANIATADGGTKLVLNFNGFDVGDKLVFSIDVDEVNDTDLDAAGSAQLNTTDPNALTPSQLQFLNDNGFDSIASGIEFQKTHFQATFEAAGHEQAVGNGKFRNVYDTQVEPGIKLDLTNDNGDNPAVGTDIRDRTDGVFVKLQQKELPISISGTVYHDRNFNKNQDGIEQGIANVTLNLYKKDSSGVYQKIPHSATTNSDGFYKFDTNLGLTSGEYQVREVQPADYKYSTVAEPGKVEGNPSGTTSDPNVISDIKIPLGGQHSTENDFGEAKPAEISGFVYHDRNDNGVKDPGEEGIGGVDITVTPGTTIDPSQPTVTVKTNPDGSYRVAGLAPGVYQVTEGTVPPEYYDGKDTLGSINNTTTEQGVKSNDEFSAIKLISTSVGTEYNFGELKYGSIQGNVHLGTPDGDCVDHTDPTRVGVANAVVQLFDASGTKIREVKTDSNGNYSFDNLKAGVYRVEEVTPGHLLDGDHSAGTINGVVVGVASASDETSASGNDVISGIKLASGEQSVNNDFCEHEPASLSGLVWHDRNNDGVRQAATEEVIAGVEIKLLDSSGKTIRTTKTTSTGQYAFTGLKAGDYTVMETTPSGYIDGKDNLGLVNGNKEGDDSTNDMFSQVSLKYGEKGVEYDFGELKAGSISGNVSLTDENGDCVDHTDPSRVGVQGAVVRLFDSTGNQIAQTTTDANGDYSFDNLAPGTYRVEEETPAHLLDGDHSVGTINGTVIGVKSTASGKDIVGGIKLASGEDAVNYDFCEHEPASISGLVWHDRNDDGVRQAATEEVIAGVEIKLLDASGNTIRTTTTDTNGRYQFTGLKAGDYSVMETTPSGFIDGKDNLGTVNGTKEGDDSTNDMFTQVSLKNGQRGVEYDFGELKPGAISGFVHADEDGDCVIDAGEQLLQGVTITLTNNDTGQVFTTTTDVNGFYQFDNLAPGNYTITQTQPGGYVSGGQVAGTAGGDASVTNVISNITLGSEVNSQNNNFCEHEPPTEEPPTEDPPIVNPPTTIVTSTPLPPATPAVLAPSTPVTTPGITTFSPPVFTPGATTTFISGVSASPATPFSWHLSVIDGGNPRGSNGDVANVAFTNWRTSDFNQATWMVSSGEGDNEIKEVVFGLRGATPVVGDFNGDGVDELGLFLDGEWFLDVNGDGKWDKTDLWAKLGEYEDQPVVGDWDGDGKDDIGVFGPEWDGDERHIEHEAGLPDADNNTNIADYRSRPNQEKNVPPSPEEATNDRRELQLTDRGKARADLIDHVFRYGEANEKAITGDWNGDGIRTIGTFKDGRWYLDTDGDGTLSNADQIAYFGNAGDLPVVGDWNGDGIDDIGVFSNGVFKLDSDGDRRNETTDENVAMGRAGDIPLAGDFNGDGVDEPAVYRENDGPINREARLR